ncbi:SCO3242 family prenyltransferase [Micromonospora krabiensis]|uniref:4-hydroxybenzoate polyprenyltransferase n=1 Tax=Micromonospora krabiensis TaxID=307121 RepID=A0A1C3NCB6_9ACTN|nr:UbiA family prenyltransferase [Micromonospora krabiensis]SBV30236.1 4-hydroxybenzoate polyprenyltransferase [Micromonospora krabiensis]
MARLADLVELVRAPAALSVPGDVVAGAAAAGALDRRTPALAGASVLLYWAGMAANDWADRRLDAVERPERPIPSGRVHPAAAVGLAAGLTAAGLGLATAAGGRRAAAVAVPLAAAVWGYDLRAKNTAAGPAVMAACRGLDVLLGATGGRLTRALPAALTVAAHTWTVTALSRREVTGADTALPLGTLAGTALVAASAAARPRRRPGDDPARDTDPTRGDAGPRSPQERAAARRDPGRGTLRRDRAEAGARDGSRRAALAAALPAALATWYAAGYGRAQARVLADPSAGRVRAAVGAGITGLPALQGALTARGGAGLLGLAVAAAGPLGRRLARKISPT